MAKGCRVYSTRTAGKPLHSNSNGRDSLSANGEDLAHITVSVVDKNGNLCPADSREVRFKVNGNGTFRANANGDATSLEQFHLPHMKAFSAKSQRLYKALTHPAL